jgi:hypothetical protein
VTSFQGNHTTLGAQSSSSFVQSTQQFQVTYGSGAVQGLLCQDNVNIGGLALNNHTFGVATAESIQFASTTTPFDGLMGLAQSVRSFRCLCLQNFHLPVQTLSQEKVLTPVEALAANKLIQSPITSFKIPRLSDQLNDGEVTFGGLDPTKFVANTLVTIPNANTAGFWEGAMDAITVNGASTGLTGRTAILDTGTTLILAPPSDAQQVMQSLGGACDAQQCTIPCTTQASLALSFGNTSFAIDPKDLAVLPINPNDPTGTCTAGIQPQMIGTATEWLVSGSCPPLVRRRRSTKRSGWRCFPEKRLLLHRRREEPDLTCETGDNLIVLPLLLLSRWVDSHFVHMVYYVLNGWMQITYVPLL